MSPTPRRMKRRRFVTLLALGGGALVTAPLSRVASAVTSARPVARRTATAAMRREIANQEKSLAGQLATIRAFTLPPGSPMAFAFRPMRARKRSRS